LTLKAGPPTSELDIGFSSDCAILSCSFIVPEEGNYLPALLKMGGNRVEPIFWVINENGTAWSFVTGTNVSSSLGLLSNSPLSKCLSFFSRSLPMK
jgi:hypothetical protein